MKTRNFIFIGILIIFLLSCTPVAFAEDTQNTLNDICWSYNGACAMAIKKDGSLWTWGYNDSGQLGDGTFTDRYSPVKVMENVKVVKAIETSHSTGVKSTAVAAIKNDNSLWVWGDNIYDSLGLGKDAEKFINTPIKIMENVKEVYSGYRGIYILKDDNSLWATGFIEGDTHVSIPTKISENIENIDLENIEHISLKACLEEDKLIVRNGSLTMLENVDRYSGNPDSTAIYDGVLMVKKDGSLWTMIPLSLYPDHDNEYGQLGDGTNIPKYIPIQIMPPDSMYIKDSNSKN